MWPSLTGLSVCIATLCLTASVAHAQQTTRAISGRVIDADLDEGVPGVRVFVEGLDPSAVTDEEGGFTLAELPHEPLTLRFEGEDYETRFVQVGAETLAGPLRITLVWAGEAEEVQTVARSWREVKPASTQELDARQLEAAPRRSAEEVLRQVPGLTLVQHGSEGKGYQYFMRGFDAIHGSDLEIEVDGMPINEWSNVHAQGYLDLGVVIPEFIELVEVTKGPFTLEQGAFAMAGSAAYRLGVPEPYLGRRVAYTYGTTGRHRVFTGYSPAGGSGQEFVGAEATRDEGFGQQRGIERASFNARKRLLGDARDDTQLDLTALGSAARFELPGPLRQQDVARGKVGFYDTYDDASRGESARVMLSATLHTRRDAYRTDTTLHAGYRHLDLLENFTGFLIDPVHGDRRQQTQQTFSYGLSSTIGRELGEHVNLKAGFGLRADRLDQREVQIDRELLPRDARRDLSATQLITHGLLGLQWRPVRDLSVDAGTRYDIVHINTRDALTESSDQGTLATPSPRLSARWQAHPAWNLFTAYGQGYRPPEARAFSSFEAARTGLSEELYEGGEPALTTSHATELGVQWAQFERVSARLTGFATWIARESLFDHVSGTSLELSGTRRLGGELVVDVMPMPWLTLSADATYAHARFIESGAIVPLVPWLVGGLRAVATHPSGWRAGYRTLYVAPRTLPHRARGATLVRHDLTAGYQWRAIGLGLEVENLLDAPLREGEYHYASHWEQGSAASQLPVLHTTAGAPLNARLTLGIQF